MTTNNVYPYPKEGTHLIKYIQPIKPKQAEGLVKPVYQQIKRDFGNIVEPFLVHSLLPELLAGAWMACRETELVGNVPRNIKEAVAIAVSNQNQCPYCVDAHTIMLVAGGDKNLAKNLKKQELIQEEKTKGIIDWILGKAPANFPDNELPEIIGTIVYFHYINRIANIFLGDTPLPSNQPLLKGGLTSIASTMFSSAVKRPKTAGESLEFLPETELPTDLAWANGSPNVAGAFARFAKAMEIDGEFALPIEVRLKVEEYVTGAITEKRPYKEPFEVAQGLADEAQRVAVTLSVMTALSSRSVNEKVIADFKAYYPQDTKLLGAVAWASFLAARKIGLQLVLEAKKYVLSSTIHLLG